MTIGKITVLLQSVKEICAIISSQSKKKPNIWNRASVSRRRMLATVVLCSGDFKLYFHTSHITPLQLVIELRELEWKCVQCPRRFFASWKMILKSNAFAWNSVSNWEKPLRRLFRCCNRLMGRTRNVRLTNTFSKLVGGRRGVIVREGLKIGWRR